MHESREPQWVRSRDAEQMGFTKGMLRGQAWCHPTRGVALRHDLLHDLAMTCRAVQQALPEHAVWTHLTAAQLRGWWLPSMLASVPPIVSSDGEAPHHDRRGVYVRRVEVPPGHRTTLDGVRLCSAAWAIAELAEDLSLIDLVIVIDCALHAGDCTKTELWDVCVRGRRGVRTLRRAIRLADGRSESPWETVLRLLHVLCDVTDVHPQQVLRTAEGAFVARADLRIGRTRRLHEYDGGEHRKQEQHVTDLAREKRLSREGWERHGYTAREIVDDPGQVIRDAEHALGRGYDPSQLATWTYEAGLSTVTAAGRARLTRRLRRFDRTESPWRRRARDRQGSCRSTFGRGRCQP